MTLASGTPLGPHEIKSGIGADGDYAGPHCAQTDLRSGLSGRCTGNGNSEIDYTATFGEFKVARLSGGTKKLPNPPGGSCSAPG